MQKTVDCEVLDQQAAEAGQVFRMPVSLQQQLYTNKILHFMRLSQHEELDKYFRTNPLESCGLKQEDAQKVTQMTIEAGLAKVCSTIKPGRSDLQHDLSVMKDLRNICLLVWESTGLAEEDACSELLTVAHMLNIDSDSSEAGAPDDLDKITDAYAKVLQLHADPDYTGVLKSLFSVPGFASVCSATSDAMDAKKKQLGPRSLLVKASKLLEDTRAPACDMSAFALAKAALQDAMSALADSKCDAVDVAMLKTLCESEAACMEKLTSVARSTVAELCTSYARLQSNGEAVEACHAMRERMAEAADLFDWHKIPDLAQAKAGVAEVIERMGTCKADLRNLGTIMDSVKWLSVHLGPETQGDLEPNGSEAIQKYQDIKVSLSTLRTPLSEEQMQAYHAFADKFTVASHAQALYHSKLAAWQDTSWRALTHTSCATCTQHSHCTSYP